MTDPAPTPEPPPVAMNDLLLARQHKLSQWEADGVTAFGQRFDGAIPAAAAKASFVENAPTPIVVTVAGRITAYRAMGKSVFADLRDSSERIQLYAQINVLGEAHYERFKRLDLGDIIGVTGELFKTRMGEVTIRVQQFTLLSKALRPLPDKWGGLADPELRYRQRYLDLVSDPAVMHFFQLRSRVLHEIRAFLEGKGFTEVETPMMQPLPGGAVARPFVTHYHALNCPMYLRIAPELYLKRLLVGGMEKVFELNRVFRNEGISKRHNPEYTLLEVYQAYGDCRTMMDLIEELVTGLADRLLHTQQLRTAGDQVIDLARPWRRAVYADLVREHLGADWYDVDDATRLARAQARGLNVHAKMSRLEVTHEAYEKLIEPTLIQPTFVTRLPRELVPLAKVCPDDPTVVDVYELEINGQEISPGYSELNDPRDQRRRFEEQMAKALAGDPEQPPTIDEDFLLALEHGMPPAGGLGVGIDRLLMLLAGIDSIRDVILFPQLRAKT